MTHQTTRPPRYVLSRVHTCFTSPCPVYNVPRGMVCRLVTVTSCCAWHHVPRCRRRRTACCHLPVINGTRHLVRPWHHMVGMRCMLSVSWTVFHPGVPWLCCRRRQTVRAVVPRCCWLSFVAEDTTPWWFRLSSAGPVACGDFNLPGVQPVLADGFCRDARNGCRCLFLLRRVLLPPAGALLRRSRSMPVLHHLFWPAYKPSGMAFRLTSAKSSCVLPYCMRLDSCILS